jgi:transposase-like protein
MEDEFLLATFSIVRYFARNKVSREIKAGVVLSVHGRSVSQSNSKEVFHVAKESVRKWIIKFEEAFARKKLARKKERDVILLDETRVKRNGRGGIRICLP